MSRAVITGSVDQSIRFWAYDSAGAVVEGEAWNSAGMAVSVIVRSAGRIMSTTALTLQARSGAGVHTDSALTEVSNGEYVVDLPDSYSATADRDISLSVASTAITGTVIVETLAVGKAVELDSGGAGARTVTITVNDGATALQNALVRLTEGVNSYTALTNASGVAVFNVDDATWTVSITKVGYTYAGTTLIVDGTEAATYSMMANVVSPPSNPLLSALEVLCVDENGDPEADVDVDIRIITVPSGDVNVSYKGSKQTATSGVDGIARFEAVRGAVYEYKRGLANVWERVTIDNDSSTNVASFIGTP